MIIAQSNPLQVFFKVLVTKEFDREVALRDPSVQDYVTNLLVEFCDREQLFQIRDSGNRQLDDVGQMLLETDPVYGPAPSFDRERQVRKHIGDYALFFSGMFPESINHYRLRRYQLEGFVDFVKAGKESYDIVSKFDFFEYQKVAVLFKKLSREFEPCMYALHRVKNEIADKRYSLFQQDKTIIM